MMLFILYHSKMLLLTNSLNYVVLVLKQFDFLIEKYEKNIYNYHIVP